MKRFFAFRSYRVIAMILVLATLLTALPLTVFAAESQAAEEPVLSPSDVPELLDYDDLLEQRYVTRLYEEEQDLYSYLFGRADGTKTRVYYQYPVKYIDETGEIRDKSLELISETVNGIRQYVSFSSDIDVTFPNLLSAGIELSCQDWMLSMIPEMPSLLSAGALSEDGRSVRYTLDEHTYINYALTYTGIKEDIVVTEYTGCTEYSFLMNTNGLTVVSVSEGEYALADESGEIQAYLDRKSVV